ncbi:MAG: DUF4388 domain-containing protein [candidate division Zixibacteria bacterium]|nr:DUF4388 domain-containing protein [candidate division Zixibacteria bacterium]
MMDLDLQGKIERFTLPEIFQLVSTGRKTGTLGIQRDDDIVMVYFRNGSVIYGYGPRKTYHIGRMLVEMGRITPGQLDEVIAEQAAPTAGDKRLGQLLIEKRYIDRADLEEAVRRQVEELIFSLMSWDRGSFKFYENQFPTEEEITVNLSTENVILEGLRRLDEMNRLKDCLPDFATVYVLAPAEPGQVRNVSLKPEEWNILALVDGHKNINDLLLSSPSESVETLKHIASLQLAGLIRPSVQAADQDKLESMVAHLSRLIENYLTRNTSKTIADGTVAGSDHDQI